MDGASNPQEPNINRKRSPSGVLNPALHSAAGNVERVCTSSIESADIKTEKGDHRHHLIALGAPTTPLFETETASSQNNTTTVPSFKQQPKSKTIPKPQVNMIDLL